MGPFAAIAAVVLAVALVQSPGGNELDAYLARQRRVIDDSSKPVEGRERLALELAAALDRAAQAAADGGVARRRWGEAVGLLDEFTRKNPSHPRAAGFRLQSAVYQWAVGRSWAAQSALDPGDVEARDGALEALEAAIARLEPLASGSDESTTPFAQNVRYRLARALADRADLRSAGGAGRALDDRNEAIELLRREPTEPSLVSFAALLRAELWAKLGEWGRAESTLREAEAADPKPPAAEAAEVAAAVAAGRRQFAEGLERLSRADLPTDLRDRLAVVLLIAQRADASTGRAKVEAEIFRRLEALQAEGGPQSRLALMASARAIVEPDRDASPRAWELLADGALALGDPARASRLNRDGAARAADRGLAAEAANLLYRAAAVEFRAGELNAADVMLTKLVDDPTAGALRPKASLLRALARDRRASADPTEARRRAYLDALEAHLAAFSDDPTSDEVRWRLGALRAEAGRLDDAIALWLAVKAGQPRWLDARLAAVGALVSGLDRPGPGTDPAVAGARFARARDTLAAARSETDDRSAQLELDLARAELELLPGLGDPKAALESAERLERIAETDAARDRADRIQVLATALAGRYVEAERTLRADIGRYAAADRLAMARRLDRAAASAPSDLTRRRLGLLARLLAEGAEERSDQLAPLARVEARLRRARAAYFAGDLDGARRLLAAGSVTAVAVDPGLLRDFAEAHAWLDLHTPAAAAYRRLARGDRPGSPAWFDDRYALALALYRSGKADEARRLIDGTAVLYPDLGGGPLKEKYDRLRRRLGQGGS